MTGTSTRSAPVRNESDRPPSTSAPLGAPVFVLNLKTYPKALGRSAVELARALERAGTAAAVAVAVCPAQTDLARVAGAVRIPVLAQHADPFEAGARTGSVPVESVAAAGARGSLVNHSEHGLTPPQIAWVTRRLRELDLVPVVCARSERVARALAQLHPPYLAVEPPELIGGRRAVSTARPELIERTVRSVHAVFGSTRVLCGAGIHTRRDVGRALELGSEGVLVASAVANSPNPAGAIADLLAGF